MSALNAAKITDGNEFVFTKLSLEAGRTCAWDWDLVNNVVTGDQLCAALFGQNYNQQPWTYQDITRSIFPDDLVQMQSDIEVAAENEGSFEFEFRQETSHPATAVKTVQWLRSRGQIVARDTQGVPTRLLGVTWDATKEKQHDDAMKLIAGELDHRAKNSFAVIRAMINLGMRESKDVQSFGGTLRGQIEAIASAHALAADISRTTEVANAPVPVLELVQNTMMAWTISLPEGSDKLRISGDKAVAIPSETAASLAMIIYQLAVNSVKHGALGPLGGALTITLNSPNATEFNLQWDEGFDTVLNEVSVTKPNGLGSQLIKHSAATLQGKITRSLSSDGLHFGIRIPI